MTQTAHFLAPRPRLWAGSAVLLTLFLGWAAAYPAAQPTEPNKKQRVEEEDDTPAKTPPKRKIRVEEEDPNAKPVRPGINPSGNFAQLARQTTQPEVKKLYRKLAVPHDVLQQRVREAIVEKPIVPLEQFYGSNRNKLFGTISFLPILEDQPGNPASLEAGVIQAIEPYELLALAEVTRFRKATRLDLYEQLQVEEQVLSIVLRFHGSARESGQRKGEEWNDVGDQLRVRLRDTLLSELRFVTEANEWDAAFTLARRVADAFPSQDDQEKIAPRILELLQKALAINTGPTINAGQIRDLHQRLRALIEQFPRNAQLQTLKQGLQKQAEKLFAEAQSLGKSSNRDDLERAQRLLHQAEEIWPTLEGLEKHRAEIRLKYPILRVGVRQLPKNLSPHTAVTDSELRAVEMMFESLVKFSPNAAGLGRYEPGLATGRPEVVELGRQFQLPSNLLWSDGKSPLDLNDVRATFRALKEGRGPDHSLVWQNLFADKEVSGNGDVSRLQVHLSKGYLEPLALMNAKIVPAGALRDGQANQFGIQPLGSGPFVFDGVGSEQARPFARFMANPHFGARAGKLGLPLFREVRFFVYKDALAEIKSKQLSILLDLTAEEAVKIKEESSLTRFTVPLPNHRQPNRRVYFLAVNQRLPALADENLRAALSLAIDREKLLDQHFRGSLKREVHQALNSPYPAHCWATDPKLHNIVNKNSCDPFDLALAKSKFAKAAAKLGGELTLRLKYPEEDAALASALTELAEQIQAALPKVKLELIPVEQRALRQTVETTFDYDLAYYHYDFPDDTFWLGPLFGPKRFGDQVIEPNIFNYKSEDLPEQLQRSIDYRAFAQVREHTQRLHNILARETPLIPLWQLDPLHAFSLDVTTGPLEPLRVFTDIEKWHLERKGE